MHTVHGKNYNIITKLKEDIIAIAPSLRHLEQMVDTTQDIDNHCGSSIKELICSLGAKVDSLSKHFDSFAAAPDAVILPEDPHTMDFDAPDAQIHQPAPQHVEDSCVNQSCGCGNFSDNI